jgi:TolB-like protein
VGGETTLAPDAIRAQLERILASAPFANAPSIAKMLRYVVEHALDGEADRLKEYTLGVEVFGRGGDFDPRQDTIVRVQARRLRERLADYYREHPDDPIVVRLPTGHYIPEFHARETHAVAPPPAPAPWRWKPIALTAGTAALCAVLGVVALKHFRPPPDSAAPRAATHTAAAPQRIAVLPFTDLSQAHDQEYLADGLSEEILNQLAQVPALRVVGRTSSFSFKGKQEDLREIGRKLDVAHLLEGSVRREGEQLRITAQLIRTEDGSHVWSKTYARELRGVFALQDEIARDVATALSVKLDAVTFNREQGGTTNVEAYERYLRWRSTVMRELFDFDHKRERVQLAREMVALDPQCVLCWNALADALYGMAFELRGTQAEQMRAEAKQVRARIARIAPDSWVARRDRSNDLWIEGKRAEAVALAKQVVDSGPLTTERTIDYAYMIFGLGELDETVTFMEQVRAIEPMALYLSRDLQYDYIAARRFPDAEAEYRRGQQLEGSQFGLDIVAFTRQIAGKRPGGVKALREIHRRLVQEEPRMDTPAMRDLAHVFDDREAMLAVTRRAMSDEAYGGPELLVIWGSVADALGDADLAAVALRRTLESAEGFNEGRMAQFHYYIFWVYPYSSLRSHPEFKRLLIKTGVADYWRQTGNWGDGCKPIGNNDFQCQ